MVWKDTTLKIVVTGGSGFLGKATIEAGLGAGHEMKSFDRAQGNDVLGHLDDLNRAEAVIHLAGVLGTSELFAYGQAEYAVEQNVIGTLRILEWCREHNARYVGITMPQVFPSIYTATKVCATRLASAYHTAYGLPVSHVRAFNAFGPGQRHGPGHPQKIIPTFATEAWEGRPIPIWGDGEQTVDLISADSLGKMLIEAVHHGDDVTFDGGTGMPFTVNEVAKYVLEVTGSNAGIEYLPMRKGEVPTHIVAKGEGWSRLSWRPEFLWADLYDTIGSYA